MGDVTSTEYPIPFKVIKRNKWFPGLYTHAVIMTTKRNAVLCVAPKSCADVIADALNAIEQIASSVEPKEIPHGE